MVVQSMAPKRQPAAEGSGTRPARLREQAILKVCDCASRLGP